MRQTYRQSQYRYTNELVGLFVLIALLVFVAGLIYSGRVRDWFNPGETLRVVLPDDGLFGLTRGSTVEILGTDAGEVEDIVIDPTQKIHANVRIDSQMAVFVRSDSMATIRKTFGIAGDAYLEITRGFGEPLDWEYAVITAVSDRKPTDTVGDLINEMRTRIVPVIDDAQKAIRTFYEVADELRDPDKNLQQLLYSLNSIAGRIDRGEGTLGRVLTQDKLARDLEAVIAHFKKETERMGAILGDLEKTMRNVAQFSGEIAAQSKNIPELVNSLKETLRSVEMAMKDLRRTTTELPRIAENVADASDTVPILVLQVQEVTLELERLIEQLQSVWWLGGGSGERPQPASRISPLEVSP